MAKTLFVAKISNDLIGIATVRVGLGNYWKFLLEEQIQTHLHYSLEQ
jgi:hypothetical protein